MRHAFASPRHLPSRTRRHGYLYILVMSVSVIVSLLGLTAIHRARTTLSSQVIQEQMLEARTLAISGVNLGLEAIADDPDWRTNFVHNTEYPTTPIALGGGTVVFRLSDTDGNLSDDVSDAMTIYGIGRVGNAVQVQSVTMPPSNVVVHPTEAVFELDSGGEPSDWQLEKKYGIAQTFTLSPPGGVIDVKIESIEVRIRHVIGKDGPLNYSLSQDDSGSWTEIVSDFVDTSTLPGSYEWVTFTLPDTGYLDPNVPLVFELNQESSNVTSELRYFDDEVDRTGARFYWQENENEGYSDDSASKGLRLFVNGHYRSSQGQAIDFSTWTSAELP